MSNHRFREEAINVQLANILGTRGLEANAETIARGGRPDVLISLEGLKVILEGRTASQQAALMRDATERVEDGLADISIAVVYPRDLKTATSMTDLTRKIEAARYDGRIFYIASAGLASTLFEGASLDEVIQYINTVFRLRVQNDVVREQVAQLRDAIERAVDQASASNLFFRSDVLIGRLKQALGIDPNANQDERTETD
jgi:hypothetical protein